MGPGSEGSIGPGCSWIKGPPRGICARGPLSIPSPADPELTEYGVCILAGRMGVIKRRERNTTSKKGKPRSVSGPPSHSCQPESLVCSLFEDWEDFPQLNG